MKYYLVFFLLGYANWTFAQACGSRNSICSRKCSDAGAKLELFFEQQSHGCRKDNDCAGYYYRTDSCSPAVVLPKNVATPDFEKKLLSYQQEVRAACSKEWSTRPACEPLPFQAACKNGKCVDITPK